MPVDKIETGFELLRKLDQDKRVKAVRSAIQSLRALEAEVREKAVESQSDYLLYIANRMLHELAKLDVGSR